MDKQKIINSRDYSSDYEKRNFELWLTAVKKTIGNENLEELFKDKDFLFKLFYLQKNSGVSMPSYYQIKKHIETMASYYMIKANVPSRKEVLASKRYSFLYKDLVSLINFIDKVGHNKLEKYNKENELLNIKAIAILGWHGLSKSEIVNLPSRSVTKSDGKHMIILDDRTINIELYEYNILNGLSQTISYRGFPSGKMQTYKSNPNYLFKSIKPIDTPIDEDLIAYYLKGFNSAAKSQHTIIYQYLRKNGLFAEIHEEIKSSIDEVNMKKLIMQKFNCNYDMACGYEVEYNQWENTFYKE